MSNETRPSIETVLERISALDEKFDRRINGLEAKFEARFERVDSEIAQLRQDVNTGFRKIERKMTLLNRDFLEARSDQEDVLQRVESLESKLI